MGLLCSGRGSRKENEKPCCGNTRAEDNKKEKTKKKTNRKSPRKLVKKLICTQNSGHIFMN